MSYRFAGRLVLAAWTLTALLFAGKEFPARPGEPVRPGELIVKLKEGVSPAAVLGALERKALRHGNRHVLKNVPPGLAKQLAQLLDVDYVEPNRIRRTQLANPNDPAFSSQWALQTIRAAQAWGYIPNRYYSATTLPAQRVRVAILDTGVDCTHPDFKNANGTSTNSAAGGQINFSMSAAVTPTTATSAGCAFADDDGHGTHTAGILAAATQNAQGVASLGFPLELVVYKVLDSSGNGNDADLADAIMQAADAGVRVLSLSLGGPGYSQTLQDAINYAWQRNTLVIAAAGNYNTNSITFPAGANHAIGVSATDQSNLRAGFSNYGDYVDIAAPGVSITSLFPTYPNPRGVTDYGTLSGTSMSTPQVSALAGLLASTTANVPMTAVAQRIQRSANSTISNGAWDQEIGYGVIDAAAALSGSLRASTAGGVVGQVTSPDGAGVALAQVTIGSITRTTGADGLFRIANLPAGSYIITGSADGVPSVSMPVNVVAGGDSAVTIALGVSYGQIDGTVTEGGNVRAGIVVQVLSNGLVAAEGVTDAQGRYSIAVPAGSYSVRAGAVNDVTATFPSAVTVVNGASSIANGAVQRLGWIAGVVRDANGNALVNWPVSISNSGFTTGAITDATGTYRTIGLAAGSYVVQASMSGAPDAVVNVTVNVDAASTANLQFTAPTFAPIRVNAGGGTYTDPSGNVWSADSGFSSGAVYSVGSAIANTTTPPLYQSERFSSGPLQYSVAVPNGTYTVKLKFAEIFFSSAGQRVFNIQINGTIVQTNFDPFAVAGGANIAVDRTFPVNVTTGQLTITLLPVVENPKISALEILPGTVQNSPPPFTPIRVNAGGGQVVDSSGKTWAADAGYQGGNVYATGASIANTTAPALYQSERWSSTTLQYSFAVANGSYSVNLKFAEIFFNSAGQRIFNIQINGNTVQTNFDPFAAAGGANIAVDRAFPVNVTNGQIVIALVPVVQNPKISAIEITSSTNNATQSFSPVRLNSGGGQVVDGSGTTWSADYGFTGGNSYSVGNAIANTTTPALYQSERWSGSPLQYVFPAPNGAYTATLKFAEIFFTSAGQRIFDIQINGATVLSRFDPVVAAGGPFRAVDRSFPVSVTNGLITITLVPVLQNPKISAIEIVSQ